MIVVHPDDVAFFIVSDDGVRETLINCDILLKRSGLVEEFRLRCVWDSIVQTRPKHLVTELIIAALKFGIRNPNWLAVAQVHHSPIDVFSLSISNRICVITQRTDPQLPLEALFDASHRVFQTAIAIWIRLDMPGLDFAARE